MIAKSMAINVPRSKHITGLEATRLADEKRERLTLLPLESEGKRSQIAQGPSNVRVAKKAPPRLGKLGRRGDVILAPEAELQEHKAAFREVFGQTLSDEFVDEMLTNSSRPWHRAPLMSSRRQLSMRRLRLSHRSSRRLS